MARWICKTCNAVMTVRQDLVGQTKPCAKCGAPSEVTDTSAEPVILSQPTEPKPVSDIYDAIPVTIFRIILIGVGLVSLVMMASGGSDMKYWHIPIMGAIGMSTAFICWPLSLISHEAVHSRKLLQEILRQNR